MDEFRSVGPVVRFEQAGCDGYIGWRNAAMQAERLQEYAKGNIIYGRILKLLSTLHNLLLSGMGDTGELLEEESPKKCVYC